MSDPATTQILGDLLCEIRSLTGDCECGGGEETVSYDLPAGAATEQSFGIGAVAGDGSTGIKFTSGETSAELAAVHDAIAACIESGAVASVAIVDGEGATVTLELDTVVTPGGAYTGTVGDGPTSGKIRSMTVTCAGSGGKCLNVNSCGTSGGSDIPVVKSSCEPSGPGSSGDCECAPTATNFDPDRGNRWDTITVSGGTATIVAGVNGPGFMSELMAGTGCDLWLARVGAYDAGPGTGALLAEGYILASTENVNGSTYTLGAPGLGECSIASVEASLVAAGFTAAQASALLANGHAGVDVLATPGATHINGVFDPAAPTPFGSCISLNAENCATEGRDVVPTEDACLAGLLRQVCEKLDAQNALLEDLINGCDPVDPSSPECCAAGSGSVTVDAVTGVEVNEEPPHNIRIGDPEIVGLLGSGNVGQDFPVAL